MEVVTPLTTSRPLPGSHSPRSGAPSRAARRVLDRTPALLRILKLEHDRGQDDGAVFGGLDAFLARWQAEEPENPALARLSEGGLLPAGYKNLDAPARADWAARAVSLVAGPAPKASPSPELPVGASRPVGTPLPDAPDQATVSPAESAPPRKTTTPKEATARDGVLAPDASVAALRSVRGKTASLLSKLGVSVVRDLAYLFPRRHNEVRAVAQLRHGEEQTTVATLRDAHPVRLGRAMQGTEAVAGDDTGDIRVVWFNQRRLAQWLKPGARYILTGRVSDFRGDAVLESPEHEEVRAEGGLATALEPGRLFPIYPSTEGLYQPSLRRAVREALARCAGGLQDVLPPDLLRRLALLPLRQALWAAHYPESLERYEAARQRLAFEELFIIQVGVLSHRREMEGEAQGIPLRPPTGFLQTFLATLPFQLPAAQERVLGEALGDMASDGRAMSRLLQGEVGSGKTVVALAALLVAAACGYQGAIMAPTEVLAEQHFLTVKRLLEKLAEPSATGNVLTVALDPYPKPIKIGLLTGGTTLRQKRTIQRLLSGGALDIIIGTHALIQEEVQIPRLALAVVDEQHRFGVMQRAALRRQGLHPHLLVMSATPIPRTLALTLYGDLDLSTIDQLPPGRQKVRTRVVGPERRTDVYDFIRKEAQAGRQAFIIYPLIDESEAVNARAAVAEEERLSRTVFPDLRLGLLHGRMGATEKQEVMEAFRQGEIDVLVSTPVVEVGIDVPNATVMVVEGADRFGLAQLHQFRGRVGRGEHPSSCVLIAETPSTEGRERLAALEQLDDGFQLAEVDLKLRGPGDYFGTRQSGLPDLRMARLTDTELLAQAREEALALLAADPGLSLPEHAALRKAVARFSAVGGEVG
ncbi:MAG: ATP-dependent DNA helicase RecG [Chloroflexi bacterium]|nr:ATP-dependent DNA helicase RecG [Chloroflexota bacterium]